MKAFHQYWTFSAIRGVLTVVAAGGVMLVPEAAGAMLSLPFLLRLGLDCFAAYSLFDAGWLVLLALLLPEQAWHRRVLYAQVAMGVFTGVVMFAITFGAIPLHWAVWAAVAHLAVGAVCEAMIARDTQREFGGRICSTSAVTLALGAVVLPFASGLQEENMAVALASMLGLYGLSEVMTGGYMLFREYRQEHPAEAADNDWVQAMEQGVASRVEQPAALPGSCEACPAGAFCRDCSPAAHWEQVLNQRQPLIVRSVRLTALQDCHHLQKTA